MVLCPDVGPSAGLGHVQRCLSLAQALQAAGAECSFLVPGDAATEEHLREGGFPVRHCANPAGAREILSAAREAGASVAVVDSYRAGAATLERLRAAGLCVAAVDDPAAFPFPCQVVVNGAAGAEGLPYRSSSGDTLFLLGPPYLMLRPEFRDVPPRPIAERAERVLMTLGGTDRDGLTAQLLRAVGALRPTPLVTAVVGPFFEEGAAIQEAAGACLPPARIVEAPPSLAELLRDCDVAVTAGGQTTYEAAACGTPVVAVEAAPNQALSLAALAGHGVLWPAGRVADATTAERVAAAVASLLADADTRARMARAGRALVDGRGAERVAEALIENGMRTRVR